MQNINFEERKAIFYKPIWSIIDIRAYFDVGSTKAQEIRNASLKYNAIPLMLPKCTYRDAIFKVMGLSVEAEAKLWKGVE